MYELRKSIDHITLYLEWCKISTHPTRLNCSRKLSSLTQTLNISSVLSITSVSSPNFSHLYSLITSVFSSTFRHCYSSILHCCSMCHGQTLSFLFFFRNHNCICNIMQKYLLYDWLKKATQPIRELWQVNDCINTEINGIVQQSESKITERNC